MSLDVFKKAADASDKLAKVLVEAIGKFSSWLTRVNAAQNQTKAVEYVGFLEVYLNNIHQFIQQTNLKRLQEKGLRIGYDPPKTFTKEMAKEYAEKSIYLEAVVNGVTKILELENPSWTVAKSSIIKLGRFLLGKHGLKFATKEIKPDSAYRFFEGYHEQSVASVKHETEEERTKFAQASALQDELDDIGVSDEVVELSQAELEFLTALNQA
jgi:hypothetical protein